MDENTIAGFVLLVLGGLQAIRPDLFLRFQVWVQKTIFDAQYIPSPFTVRVMRSIGAALVILGLLVLTGAIE